MEIKISAMQLEDRLYVYHQSAQLEGQTGCIGHLRGDFGDGQEFYSSWFDHHGEYKTNEFKAEFDEVVNTLREKDGLFFSRDSMSKFCKRHPQAEMMGSCCTEYGFKLQTAQYIYMLRCNPIKGEYNFHIYAYVGQFLEHHMGKAQKGIRFVDTSYKELFRIPDGGKIRVQTPDGKKIDRTCRYVDDYHVEIGGSVDNLYHICQFAEMMERNGNIVQPLQDKSRTSQPKQKIREGR